jgi:hypothetical protein
MKTQSYLRHAILLTALMLSFNLLGCPGPTVVPAGTPQCGNSIVEGSEQCDGYAVRGFSCLTLGFNNGAIACTASCQLDTSGCTIASPVMNLCGNGLLDAGELCDGANFGDLGCESYNFIGGQLLCSADCKTIERQLCKRPEQTQQQVCGDGIVTGSEVCDGNEHGSVTCGSLGHAGGILTCAADCLNFNESQCTTDVCGDGKKEASELCDGADLGNQSCKSLGFKSGTLSCQNGCKSWDFSNCSNISPATCGNNTVEAGEVCDGTDLQGKSCADFGSPTGTLGCNSACTAYVTSTCVAAATATSVSSIASAGKVTVQDAIYLPGSGDVMITGSSWQNGSQIGPLTLGNEQGFLIRIDPVVRQVVWAKALDYHGVAVSINSWGDVYVSTYSFDGYGAAVLVYDESGTLMEERKFEPLTATSDVRIKAIVPVDDTNFLKAGAIIVGEYLGDVDFDGDERSASGTKHHGFVSRIGFPSSEWFTSVGSAVSAAGFETVTTDQNTIIAGGYYTGQLSGCQSQGGRDLLVARFDKATGAPQVNDCHGGPGDDLVTAIQVHASGLHVAGVNGPGLKIFDDQFSRSTHTKISGTGQFLYRSSLLAGFAYWSSALSGITDKVRLSKSYTSPPSQSSYVCHALGATQMSVKKIGATGTTHHASANGDEISCEALLNTGQGLFAFGNYETWASMGGFSLPSGYSGYEWKIQ